MRRVEKDDSSGSPATHVCMPVLSLVALLSLAFSKKKTEIIVHYDVLPRYLRGISRFLKIPARQIIKILSLFSGIVLKDIEHGDDCPGYPSLHLRAMETVTRIAGQLILELPKSPWMHVFDSLLGEKPSCAYIAKYLCEYQLFPAILPVMACHAALCSQVRYMITWSPLWPGEWLKIVRRELDLNEFEFFEWPKLFVLMTGVFIKYGLMLRMSVVLFKSIARRGLSLRPMPARRYKLMTEFVDHRRLNGTPYDSDYWVDGENVKKEDVFFFITSRQRWYLKEIGYTTGDVKKTARDKGYEIRQIDDMPYTFQAVCSLISTFVKVFKKIFYLDSTVLCSAFQKGWSEYIHYLPLFLNYSAKHLIYLTMPNGHTSVRFDDAVVTALCRKYGINSVGCQTRTIYSRNFEYCFDCYDIYLSWGAVWQKVLGDAVQFLDKIVVVGCIYLDKLIPEKKQYFARTVGNIKKMPIVAVFDSDISQKHHYTYNYIKQFFVDCAILAASFPQCKFIVKAKDPGNIDIMLRDKDFFVAYSAVADRFEFIPKHRHEYAEIISSADIIIAIGYTTPGAEGLLLGKRAIYYSSLDCGGQAFKDIPSLVAKNYEELCEIFRQAIKDNLHYIKDNSAIIDQLDSFRDGEVRLRIYKALN